MNDSLVALSDRPELTALALDFVGTDGPDLLGRWGCLGRFWDARLAARLDPYFRVSIERTRPECVVLTRNQEEINGINFAAHDYLSLAYHPALRQAAIDAVGRWGVHTTGSIVDQGGSVPLLVLENRLADFLCCSEVATFPSGWAAGYSAVRALVRELDHVVIDSIAHDCLQEGAVSATHNVHRVLHASHEAISRRLAEIRDRNASTGILVVTQSLFPLDSSAPDLRAIQDACRAYKATLLINAAHDLGAIGDGGLGFVGEQGMIGEADIIMGSFSKTFGSNGGFVASRQVGLKQALRTLPGPYLCSNALSPIQASIVLAALDVVRSREGAQRRRKLATNFQRLRDGLKGCAFRVLGRPSAIVPVWLGNVAEARLMTRSTLANGALVTLTEHPVVSRTSSRWRLQVMADHSLEQVDKLIAIAVAAREEMSLSVRRPIIGCGRELMLEQYSAPC
jgi:glycine C-acetyltransferase